MDSVSFDRNEISTPMSCLLINNPSGRYIRHEHMCVMHSSNPRFVSILLSPLCRDGNDGTISPRMPSRMAFTSRSRTEGSSCSILLKYCWRDGTQLIIDSPRRWREYDLSSCFVSFTSYCVVNKNCQQTAKITCYCSLDPLNQERSNQ